MGNSISGSRGWGGRAGRTNSWDFPPPAGGGRHHSQSHPFPKLSVICLDLSSMTGKDQRGRGSLEHSFPLPERVNRLAVKSPWREQEEQNVEEPCTSPNPESCSRPPDVRSEDKARPKPSFINKHLFLLLVSMNLSWDSERIWGLREKGPLSALSSPCTIAKAKIPPVLVPAIQSKISRMGRPAAFSIARRSWMSTRPRMPPPSRHRRRS